MKQYHDLLQSILKNGREHHDRTGVGTISILATKPGSTFAKAFPLLRRRGYRFAGSLRNSSGFSPVILMRRTCVPGEWTSGQNGPTKNTPSGLARSRRSRSSLRVISGVLFGGIYPERNGTDQFCNLINEIKTNPDSRRLIVTGWDPQQADKVDLPLAHTIPIQDRKP